MTISARLRRLRLRISALLTICAMTLAVASCGQPDTRTVITVWSWEPSMTTLIADFEKANPDVRVKLNNISGYDHLNSAIQDGYGTPDVVQLEYYAPAAVRGERPADGPHRSCRQLQLVLHPRHLGVGAARAALPMVPGLWRSSTTMTHSARPVSTRPRSPHGMIITRPRKKLKNIGVYIAADAGDASFYNAMIWLAGGRPFHTSSDGKTVTVDLKGRRRNQDVHRILAAHDRRGTGQHPSQKSGPRIGNVRWVAGRSPPCSPAWMPSLLLADVPGTSGLWRVTRMPTQGRHGHPMPRTAAPRWACCTPHASLKRHSRFVDYVCHNKSGIKTRVDGGAFPGRQCDVEQRRIPQQDHRHRVSITPRWSISAGSGSTRCCPRQRSPCRSDTSTCRSKCTRAATSAAPTADAYVVGGEAGAYDRAKGAQDAGRPMTMAVRLHCRTDLARRSR